MIKMSFKRLRKVARDYPGILTRIRHYEEQLIPDCPVCGSADTACVVSGIVGQTICLAGATTRMRLAPNHPSGATWYCNSCSAYYGENEQHCQHGSRGSATGGFTIGRPKDMSFSEYKDLCIRRLKEAGILPDGEGSVTSEEPSGGGVIETDYDHVGSLGSERSQSHSQISITFTEAPASTIHEEVFGEKVNRKGASQFFKRGDKVHWVTPRTEDDEKSVDKHYGQKLIHFPARKSRKKRSGPTEKHPGSLANKDNGQRVESTKESNMKKEKKQGISIKTPATVIITGPTNDRKGKKIIQRPILQIDLNESNGLLIDSSQGGQTPSNDTGH